MAALMHSFKWLRWFLVCACCRLISSCITVFTHCCCLSTFFAMFPACAFSRGLTAPCASLQVSYPDGANRTCLVPYAGLLNHSPWPHVVRFSRLDPETQCLQLTSFRSCCRGEQCYLSYGPLSNDHLLLFYGFAVPDNPFDSFSPSFDTPPSKAARKVLGLASIGTKHHLRMDMLPSRLMAFLRVAVALPSELASFAKGPQAARQLLERPVNEANEVRALQLLIKKLDSALADLAGAQQGLRSKGVHQEAGASSIAIDSPAIGNDELAHAAGRDSHCSFRDFVGIYVQGEVQILKSCLQACQQRLCDVTMAVGRSK